MAYVERPQIGCARPSSVAGLQTCRKIMDEGIIGEPGSPCRRSIA